MIDIYIQTPQDNVPEGSSFDATAYFRLSDAGTTPTTARYRIDNITTGLNMRDWTDLTPAESITIPVTPADTATRSSYSSKERMQMTVEVNTGLSTQVRKQHDFIVENIRAF